VTGLNGAYYQRSLRAHENSPPEENFLEFHSFPKMVQRFLPATGQKAEVPEKKRLNPLYSRPELVLDILSFSLIPSRNGAVFTSGLDHS
jgi:hypothetical protein